MRALTGVFSILALCSAVLPAGAALASSDAACAARDNNSFSKLLECLSVDAVSEHLDALQEIADDHDGNREAGSAGHVASAEYVSGVLEAAGYTVTTDPFEFVWDGTIGGPPTMAQTSPDDAEYEDGQDFVVGQYSGSADVEATVEPVDLNLDDIDVSTSGCEATDFDDFTPGNIALVRRGTCTFELKVTNAVAAGASALVIFNQGNAPDRMWLVKPLLDDQAEIPVVFVPFDLGVLLSGTTVALDVQWLTETRATFNLFAQTRRGSTDNVIMAGAHLDSVGAGPGIGDNGSGVAALVEIAQMIGNSRPENAVRFAFWSAEEYGLSGSYDWSYGAYDDGELDNVAVYLNVDMIASPNYVRYVYVDDGNPGSAGVNEMFLRYFDLAGLDVEETDIYGRSDQSGFEELGWPSGGLYTGAEGIKTEAEAAIYGGTAGEPLDPCYHRACDDTSNIEEGVYGEMLDAVAVGILQLAMNTASVNGLAGRPDFSMSRFETNVERALRH